MTSCGAHGNWEAGLAEVDKYRRILRRLDWCFGLRGYTKSFRGAVWIAAHKPLGFLNIDWVAQTFS